MKRKTEDEKDDKTVNQVVLLIGRYQLQNWYNRILGYWHYQQEDIFNDKWYGKTTLLGPWKDYEGPERAICFV